MNNHNRFLLVVSLFLASCGARTASSSEPLAITTPREEIESSELCVTETRGFNTSVSFAATSLSCKTRDDLTEALSGVGAYYGLISAVCLMVPEPTFTKATAAVFGISGSLVGSLSFVLSHVSCNGEGRVDLSTQRFIMKKICRETGRQYVESIGLNGEPGCSEQ